jgi:membrane-associated phospholipid phosphatase
MRSLLQPSTLVLVPFGLLLLVLTLVYPQPLQLHAMSVEYALYMMGAFALASVARSAPRLLGRSPEGRWRGVHEALRMIRDWLPFVLCLWVYENLHDLTRWIRVDTVDEALARADLFLFGVQPTLWLERIHAPLLTDALAASYMTYFFFPPLLAGCLYFRGHVGPFRELQLALLITFYLGFCGYILVPAVGPQVLLAKAYARPLEGRYIWWGTRVIVTSLQQFPRDCFPSLHTAVSTVTLLFCARHWRAVPLARLVVPTVAVITAALWFSTVYLRYHWAVDVLAGWALATLATAGGILLAKRWPPSP